MGLAMTPLDQILSPPAVLVCRLQPEQRGEVERFFNEELDEVAQYWRFFRSMTPATVTAYVEQIPFTGQGAVFGAYLGDRLVGVAELATIPADARCRSELLNPGGAPSCADIGIAVSGRERRRGIARSLLEGLMHHAWARGIKLLQVTSLKGNRPMVGLAEALGFTVAAEQNDEVVMHAFRPAGFLPQPATECATGEGRECRAPEGGVKPGRQLVCPLLLFKPKCP